MRILYVEDNRELRETIGMLMEGDGRTVVQCETGEQALAQDAERPFDVVVTDISLPGMSGIDLARELLSHDRERWVVLCSGYELENYAQAWGANVRTLLKPFEIDELDALLSEIAVAVRKPQAARPAINGM